VHSFKFSNGHKLKHKLHFLKNLRSEGKGDRISDGMERKHKLLDT